MIAAVEAGWHCRCNKLRHELQWPSSKTKPRKWDFNSSLWKKCEAIETKSMEFQEGNEPQGVLRQYQLLQMEQHREKPRLSSTGGRAQCEHCERLNK